MKHPSTEGTSPVVFLELFFVDGLCPFVNFRGSTLESIKFWWPIVNKYRKGKVKKNFFRVGFYPIEPKIQCN